MSVSKEIFLWVLQELIKKLGIISIWIHISFIIKSNNNNSSTNSQVLHIAGYANTTSAINAVRFQANTGNLTVGSIALYGIKDS